MDVLPLLDRAYSETIDVAAKIIEQCRKRGVKNVHDSGVCTACHPDLYYSYRAEKGKTGRMLALLGLT